MCSECGNKGYFLGYSEMDTVTCIRILASVSHDVEVIMLLPAPPPFPTKAPVAVWAEHHLHRLPACSHHHHTLTYTTSIISTFIVFLIYM